MRRSKRNASRALLTCDPKHPLPAPLYANRRGLPPLLVQVGEDELLLDDARRLAARALDAGVDATLEIWAGLCTSSRPREPFPDSRQAMRPFPGHHVAATSEFRATV